MRKITAILLCLVLAFSLSSCMNIRSGDGSGETTAVTESVTLPYTEPETTEPESETETVTETETETTTAVTTTLPQHSPLYIEGVSTSDMIRYFAETVLSAEYGEDNGNKNLVQKWETPIRYYIHGLYSSSDAEKIDEFFDFLNTIDGFPGAKRVGLTDDFNFEIDFITRLNMEVQLRKVDESCAAFTTFNYYTGTNNIYKTKIIYCIDIPEEQRRSVIQEEIVNGIGMANDTEERTDSVIYQYSNYNTVNDVDTVLLKILYSDKIKCGMDYDRAAKAIAEIYY